MIPKGEQIADYAWLSKTQRSWHIWIGNPFCISLQRVPLKETTREQVVKLVRDSQVIEKARFFENFPDVKWESM